MRCPVCGEESFAKKKSVIDGWKVVGVIEVCALCGAELQKSADHQAAASDSANRLAALLGGEAVEKVTLSGDGDMRFCRNCRYFLVHPFKTVCALSDTEVDPMGECGKFERQ